MDDDWHPAHRPPPRPHHPLPEDHFPGNLGFGADTDLCLYQNFPQLSDDCQGAVSDLYHVRADYWEEYNDNQHHPPSPLFCFLLIVGAVLLVLGFVKRLCMYKKRRQVAKFLDALNANPKLKAQVEHEMGQPVPPPMPSCCAGKLHAVRTTAAAAVSTRSRSGTWGGFCVRMLKALLFLGAVFVISLFISITSLEMTAAIVDHMDANARADESGEVPPVSPFFALFILFSICAAQLFLLGLVVRGIKLCVSKGRCEEDREPVAAAAMTTSEAASGSGNTGSSGFSGVWRNVMLMPRNLPAVGSVFRRSYQPVSSADDDSMVMMQTPTAPLLSQHMVQTEMVSMPPQQAPPQMAVIVPAAPVTSISMV